MVYDDVAGEVAFLNTNEVAAMTGTSVRTLHHYDNIGLLCPARNPANGYRDYSDADLDRLQQILFFRACGFPLEKIGQLLDSPGFDRARAFALQRKYLLRERARIDALLATLEQSILTIKGETTMTNREKFGGFDFSRNPYQEEARRLWGDEAVDKSSAHLASLSAAGQQALSADMDALFRGLAGLRAEDPRSAAAQDAVAKFHRFLNEKTGHHYTPAAFAGLGQLYVDDERFTENIDRYGAGLAAFLAEAMAAYAQGLDT